VTTFVFSLKHPGGEQPNKCIPINSNQAINHHASFGPTFGSGHDLYLADQCNQNSISYCNLGTSFQRAVPNFVSQNVGNVNFTVIDYEVFSGFNKRFSTTSRGAFWAVVPYGCHSGYRVTSMEQQRH
jgi:hypothetical protein